METLKSIFAGIKWFFQDMAGGFSGLQEITGSAGHAYTTVARWIFIALALFILVKSIISLLMTKNPSEVWAYFNVNSDRNYPITHWENVIGRSGSCDLQLNDPTVSRNQGTLVREKDGRWKFTDLDSKNGSLINGEPVRRGTSRYITPGDEITIGESVCTLFPISLEERRNNEELRSQDTIWTSPWASIIALTVFQLMTILQLKVSMEEFTAGITISFLGMTALMWIYVIAQRATEHKGMEMEIIAFFLSTLSLAVTASKFPDAVFKQFIAIIMGFILFIIMSTVLSDLDRAKSLRKYMYIAAAIMLLINLLMGVTKFGAANWVKVPGTSITFQPSEIIKLAYIWVGAACLDELMEKRNSLIFTVFSFYCFACLAIMGDFGTALIFYVTFIVISFLRSGDFTKLIMIIGVAGVGGLMVLKFKSHVANRFAAWGRVWECADGMGFQQTRTMSAAASGGLVGTGAGSGWLKYIPASETDLVFGFISEEWGIIIAVMAVLSIITLSIFAVRSIWSGRSTFYTIAACSAMSLFLFQTMLNVFGSVDIFPLTGVTFPFVSSGGTSMLSSWGMLSFLKAADTRQNASFAVKPEESEEVEVY